MEEISGARNGSMTTVHDACDVSVLTFWPAEGGGGPRLSGGGAERPAGSQGEGAADDEGRSRGAQLPPTAELPSAQQGAQTHSQLTTFQQEYLYHAFILLLAVSYFYLFQVFIFSRGTICVCVCVCVYIYIYIYTCIYFFIYIYIYIYVNIYMFIYIQDCLRKLEYCDKVLYFL